MSNRNQSSDPIEESLDLVRTALTGLRFGECVISIHEGAVVHVTRTEKLRPPKRSR